MVRYSKVGETDSEGRSGAAVLAALFFLVTLSQCADAQNKKPNIVFIFMDNFGYGELGVYGGGITRGAPTKRELKSNMSGSRVFLKSSATTADTF